MVLNILLQSVLLPLLVSLLSVYLIRKKIELWPYLIVLWLPFPIWIGGLPNFPPKLFIDWVYVFILVGLIGGGLPWLISVQKALSALVFIFFVTIINWNPITYDASFNSHWLVWLELLVISSVGIFAIFNRFSWSERGISFYLILSFVNGFAGVATVISGSLLIGFMMMSFGSFLFCIGVYEQLKNTDQIYRREQFATSLVVTLLLLVSARVYAEVALTSVAAFLIPLVLLRWNLNYILRWGMIASIIGIGLGYTIVFDVFLVEGSNQYY